jgi:hypothetical protein
LGTTPGRGRHHIEVGFSLARNGGRCPVPFGASMAVHPEEILFVSECAYPSCAIQWAICRCCYRGHRYCSEACSQQARREQKRQDNRRYRQEEYREDHAARQREYRLRQTSCGDGSKRRVTGHTSNAPPSDETLVGARRQEVMRSAQASSIASDANPHGSLSCRRCGRHSVLVEPLSERKRIGALVRGRHDVESPSAHTGTSSTTRQAFTDYTEAIGQLYAELPITPQRLRRGELDVAQQLHRGGVRLLHIEAALLVTTARRFLGNEPRPKAPIRSLGDVVPLIEQARRARVRQGYVDYLRKKLRHVLEADGDSAAKPRRRRRSRGAPRR